MYKSPILKLILFTFRKPLKVINYLWLTLFRQHLKSNKFKWKAVVLILFFIYLMSPSSSSNEPKLVANIPANVVVNNETKHLFVVKSFIYQNSIIYNKHDAIITLFNGQRNNYTENEFHCRRKLSSGNVEVTSGKILELIYGPRQCLLTTFRLLCPFNASKVNENTTSYEIGRINSNDTEEIEFQNFELSIPERKKTSFISCMSRMIAFDDWSIFLVAMESFRLYGGDFVVGYLECAIKEVADLMKIYESDGLLKIRHAYKASDTPNIPYDPDSQTEYANQMTNSHLCLYEFKESAEFIAFTDWDDILVGPRKDGFYGKIYDSFFKLSSAHPNVGAFAVQRIPFIAQKQKSYPFAFSKFKYSSKKLDPKMVARPSMVAGVWIHALKIAESPKFYGDTINDTDLAILLHFKLSNKKMLSTTNDFNYLENVNTYFNASLMQRNMEKMFERHEFTFNPSTYPWTKLFYRLIFNCYIKMEKGVQEDTIPFCPTHKACTYPKQNVRVVKVFATQKSPKKMGNYIWHERDNVKFEISTSGCL